MWWSVVGDRHSFGYRFWEWLKKYNDNLLLYMRIHVCGKGGRMYDDKREVKWTGRK